MTCLSHIMSWHLTLVHQLALLRTKTCLSHIMTCLSHIMTCLSVFVERVWTHFTVEYYSRIRVRVRIRVSHCGKTIHGKTKLFPSTGSTGRALCYSVSTVWKYLYIKLKSGVRVNFSLSHIMTKSHDFHDLIAHMTESHDIVMTL